MNQPITNIDSDRASFNVEISQIDDLGKLKRRWLDLEARSEGTFFTSWLWAGTWLQLTHSEVFLFSISKNEKDVALACLTYGNSHSKHWSVPSIQINHSAFPSENAIFPEYCDILVDKSFKHGADTILVNTLLGSPSIKAAWKQIGFAGICNPFCEYPTGELTLDNSTNRRAPWVDLTQICQNQSSFLDTLSRNTRYQIGRSERLIGELGELRLQLASSPNEAIEWFDKLVQLQQLRHIKRGNTSSLKTPFVRRFVRDVIKQGVLDNAVEVLKFEAGNVVLGYLINFIYGSTVSNYQSGFVRTKDNKLRAGYVCHVHMIEHYSRLGYTSYNFLAGHDTYKSRMATDFDTLRWPIFRHPNLGYNIERAVRHVLRRNIG